MNQIFSVKKVLIPIDNKACKAKKGLTSHKKYAIMDL